MGLDEGKSPVGEPFIDPNLDPLPISWTVPKLPAVKCLGVFWWSAKHAHRAAHTSHPTWLLDLFGSCSALTTLSWRGYEPYVPPRLVGTNHRAQIINLVGPSLANNLKDLSLHFDTPGFGLSEDVIRECGRQVSDPLNRMLRKLSQQLRIIRLQGHFLLSPELFWPGPDASGATPEKPFWPHLETFIVEARLISPEGLWYVQPGDDRDLSLGFRSRELLQDMDSSFVADLVVRMSRAMLRMQKVDTLSVSFPEFAPLDLVNADLNADWTLFSYWRLWPMGNERCHQQGVCCGAHTRWLPPWTWNWPARYPQEAVDNWAVMTEIICRMTIRYREAKHAGQAGPWEDFCLEYLAQEIRQDD